MHPDSGLGDDGVALRVEGHGPRRRPVPRLARPACRVAVASLQVEIVSCGQDRHVLAGVPLRRGDVSDPADELRAYERDLYLRAKEALSDTDARRARLAKAPKQPQAVAATTTLYVRNPDVVAEVLYLASGRCNRCRQDAPFLRRDGTPYLEVHHIVPLSHGGIDAVENAEAVCPNCHRKAHFGVGGTDGN